MQRRAVGQSNATLRSAQQRLVERRARRVHSMPIRELVALQQTRRALGRLARHAGAQTRSKRGDARRFKRRCARAVARDRGRRARRRRALDGGVEVRERVVRQRVVQRERGGEQAAERAVRAV